MNIEDDNKEVAFGTNRNGYDVFKLHRYREDEVTQFWHKENLLTDEQWQKVIDAVDEAIKKLEL